MSYNVKTIYNFPLEAFCSRQFPEQRLWIYIASQELLLPSSDSVLEGGVEGDRGRCIARRRRSKEGYCKTGKGEGEVEGDRERGIARREKEKEGLKEIEGGVLQGEGTARSAHSSSDQLLLLLLQRELQCKPPEPGSGMRRGRSNKRETNILTGNTPCL